MNKLRALARKLDISPNQIIVGGVGGLFSAAALLSLAVGWSLGRDISFVGIGVTVLVAILMLLRSLSLRTMSIRRDIMRFSQRQAAVSNRIEASTGLSSTPPTMMSEEPTVGNSLGHSGKYFGVGPEYEYAWRAAQSLSTFETFALRTRSLSMRDVFARAATGLQFNNKDLLQIVRSGRAVRLDNLNKVVGKWRPKALLTLARTVANQRLLPNDAATAILLFELVIRVFGVSALGKTDRRLYVEALVDEGRGKEALKRIKEFQFSGKDSVQAALLTANLIRPSTQSAAQDWTAWLEKINRVLAFEDAAPITLSAGLGAPLDRLGASRLLTGPAARRNSEPLVSVIVPTHNGSELIETALASLNSQTWRNIEIIVVDDCSSSAQLHRLREICSLHDKVVLVEQPVNAGAYLARNAALDKARGEFITVHDDDDWSHPEKIERQVTALIKDPTRLANMSMHTRVTEDLAFLRINNNTSFTQPNYSSIMFRRADLDAIGKWDSVNRGADAEFRDRIKNVFGSEVEVVGKIPMSFTRTRVGSLTHGELDRGYIEPARLVYLESYTQAHKQGIVGGKSDRREFAAPLDMLPEWRGKHKGDFDVVYATDFRFPGGTTSLTIGEIQAAADLGLRVGVLQLDSPLNKPGTHISPALLEILLGQRASLLRVRDTYRTSLMVIRHPSVAQFLDNILSPAEVNKCILIANTAPVLAGGSGSVYDLEECVDNIQRCFGVQASIAPESGVTRKLVREVAGRADIAGYDWPGFIDVKQEIIRYVSARLPVVGRHSRDHRLKWPDTLQEFIGAYVQPETFSTHILGGIDSISRSLPKSALANLRVSPFGGNVHEYLKELDFWVYYHSDRTIESFGMAAAEAMEAGLVVVLPEYMSATFGDGAVYAKPSEVSAVIARYWSDARLYEEQSRRARRYVEEHYSVNVYAARLRNLIAEGQVWDTRELGESLAAS